MKKKLLSNSELSLFCYQLSLIFKSGLPIDEALSIFSSDVKNSDLKAIASQMQEDISLGNNIYEAIGKYEEFPQYMKGMVEIAYNTGNLESEFSRLSDYYQEMERINQKISNAVTYPIILSSLMFIVIAFLVIKVIPMFNQILSSIGATVPVSTSVLLSVGTALKTYGIILIALLIALVFGIFYYTKNSSDAWKYKFPFIGEINKKIFSQKFALGMSMLMSGGYSFDDALGVYINTLDSKHAIDVLTLAQKNIANGQDVSQEIHKIDLFPKLFTRMLSMGYKAGELESSLNKVASVYLMEVDKTLNNVTSSIEPALIIILSAIVGIILFSVMTPLISIISSI